jgi:hypothetical protein
VQTQDALNLLIALKERVARIYFRFFRAFRGDPVAARCWWDLARDEYGHAGILKMVRELVAPGPECGEIGPRLWTLVETVERCEQQALAADGLGRALEVAIRLESSELNVLSRRILQSLEADLPDGAAGSFVGADTHHRRLVETAGHLGDGKLRQRLETMLGGSREH